MGKIFYVMGKSASGKDTVYRLLLNRIPGLETVTIHTTRPIREGETDGVEYKFSTMEQYEAFLKSGCVIESRTYQTVCGPWVYYTVDDGQFHLDQEYYLMIGTLESYESMRGYFGKDVMVPVYIYTDDETRLKRAIEREKKQKTPNYSEVCRRYLADEVDFSSEKLIHSQILKQYENVDLTVCMEEIVGDIRRLMI